MGESGNLKEGNDGSFVQQNIFTLEGINWLSFTYKTESNITIENIVPKKGEIEEAKWFTKENALRNSVSLFDKEAIMSLRE